MTAPSTMESIFRESRYVSYNSQLFTPDRAALTTTKTATRRVFEVQKVIDESHLRPFLNLRQRAFRACRSYGTKLDEFFFKGGWVVHERSATALQKELDEITQSWKDHAETKVYPNYQGWIVDFANKNPNEAMAIISLAPTLGWVQRHNWFRWGSLALSGSSIHANPGSMAHLPSTLAEQALLEISSELADAKLEKSQRHTQGCRAMFRRIRDKAQALSGLHPRLQEIAEVFDRLLPALPTSGYIEGFEATMIKAVAEAVIDLDEFIAHGFAPGAGTVQIVQTTLPLASPATVAAVPAVSSVSAASAHVGPPPQQDQAQGKDESQLPAETSPTPDEACESQHAETAPVSDWEW